MKMSKQMKNLVVKVICVWFLGGVQIAYACPPRAADIKHETLSDIAQRMMPHEDAIFLARVVTVTEEGRANDPTVTATLQPLRVFKGDPERYRIYKEKKSNLECSFYNYPAAGGEYVFFARKGAIESSFSVFALRNGMGEEIGEATALLKTLERLRRR